MKFIYTLAFFATFFFATSQNINYNGITYKIKRNTILQNGADVTTTLSSEQQTAIFEALRNEQALEKQREASEKAIKKAEKEQKKAEKKQRKAEKELKAKERAASKYDDANKDYKKAISKYERLKRKGKLSPNDEEKWLKKIENFKEDIDKAGSNL